MFKRVLFIGAHPDDVEINAGGTINKFLSEGRLVYSLTLTSSDEVRVKEALESLECLGLEKDKIFMGNHTDTKMFSELNEIIKTIELVIKTHKIDTIFTHFPFDTHQDHVTVSQASIAAARDIENIVFYSPTFPSGRTDIAFNPNLSIILHADNVNKKVSALSRHRSQIKKYGKEKYLEVIKDICSAEAWKYSGCHGYAELFQISRIKLE